MASNPLRSSCVMVFLQQTRHSYIFIQIKHSISYEEEAQIAREEYGSVKRRDSSLVPFLPRRSPCLFSPSSAMLKFS